MKESMNEEDLSYLLSVCFNIRNSFIYYLYPLYPKANIKIAVSFISSFCMLANYLERLCIQGRIKDEAALRQLYLSMLDAVNPDKEINNYCKYLQYKSMENTLKLFVETCRNQLIKLPSYKIVLEHVKKYIYLYSDLNIYKFVSDEKTRDNYLLTWAGYYINQYPLISPWEFSASANSILCILALFSSAFDPSLDINTVKDIDSVYFPWICGLNILLRDCLYYHRKILEDIGTENFNFTHNYSNLKQCEERLKFFLDYSFETCLQLNFPNFHQSIIKWMFAMCLSDPRAQLGLNKIASRNLLKNRDKSCYRLCKLLGIIL